MGLRERIDAQLIGRRALVEFDHGVIADDAAGRVIDRGRQRLSAEERERSDIAGRSRRHHGEIDRRRRERTDGAGAAAVAGFAALEAVVGHGGDIEAAHGVGGDLAAGNAGVDDPARGDRHEHQIIVDLAEQFCRHFGGACIDGVQQVGMCGIATVVDQKRIVHQLESRRIRCASQRIERGLRKQRRHVGRPLADIGAIRLLHMIAPLHDDPVDQFAAGAALTVPRCLGIHAHGQHRQRQGQTSSDQV